MFDALPKSATGNGASSPRNIVAHAYTAYKERPVVKKGGDAYLAGNSFLFLTGLRGMMEQGWHGALAHWNQDVAALGFFGAGYLYSKAGTNAKAFATAAAASIPLMITANWDSMASGSAKVIGGTIIYSLAQMFGVGSEPLTERFAAASSQVTRAVLGAPRRTMAVLAAASKVPMLVDAVSNRQWGMVAVLGAWYAGDALLARSSLRPEAPGPKRASPAPAVA